MRGLGTSVCLIVMLFAVTAFAERHGGEETAARSVWDVAFEIRHGKPDWKRWETWDALSKAYELWNDERWDFRRRLNQLFTKASLRDIPEVTRIAKSPPLEPFRSRELDPRENARVNLRLNLPHYKQKLFNQLYGHLVRNPPELFGQPGHRNERWPLRDRRLWRAAANQLADEYLRAVDAFLAGHPGARPSLDKRNFVLDALGIQNQFTHPWCADWAEGVLSWLIHHIPHNTPASICFGFDGAQANFNGYQHNFVVVSSRSGKALDVGPKANVLILDPWRDLQPKAYAPSSEPWFHPTSYGFK